MDWVDYYMGLAFAVAEKSKDTTKNGCVLVDEEYRPISIGFNGPPAGFVDDEFPTGDGKYPNIVHAELNSITNGVRTKNSIAFITGPPCSTCATALYQFGVRTIYAGHRKSRMFTGESKQWLDGFCERSKRSTRGELKVNYVKPNIDWLKGISVVENGYADDVKKQAEFDFELLKRKYEQARTVAWPTYWGEMYPTYNYEPGPEKTLNKDRYFIIQSTLDTGRPNKNCDIFMVDTTLNQPDGD